MALYTTCLVLAGFLVARPPVESPADTALSDAVAETAAHPDLAGLSVGLAVGCANGDGEIVGHDADKPLNPASGTKLLTSAAALALFEPDHRFTTPFFGVVDADGVVTGDLVIRPAGDPSLQRKSMTSLAKAIHTSGVRAVRGDVVVDLGAYPADDLPPAYDQKSSDASYRPAVPAFGIDDGALRVTVAPAKTVGEAPKVSVSPSSGTTIIDNDATTAEGKGIGELEVLTSAGPKGATRVSVRGRIGAKAPKQGVRRRMHDPSVFALEALGAALKKAGVRVDGQVRMTRTSVNVGDTKLGNFEGMPLKAIIAEININSNNYWAEALFRILGIKTDRPMTAWADAAARVTETLVSVYGLKDYDFLVVNGSGLYNATRISPRAMVRLLRHFSGESDKGAAMRDSLARAGESGTLRGRLKDLKGLLRGKTGTLDNAVSLSGFLKRSEGCDLAFASLVEGDIGDKAGRVRSAIDAWLRRLAAR